MLYRSVGWSEEDSAEENGEEHTAQCADSEDRCDDKGWKFVSCHVFEISWLC